MVENENNFVKKEFFFIKFEISLDLCVYFLKDVWIYS